MIDTSIKFVGRPNCMSGSQPLSLNISVNLRWLLLQKSSYPGSIGPDYHRQTGRAESAAGIQHVPKHWQAADRVQDLWRCRFHPRAFTGCEYDNIHARQAILRFQKTFPLSWLALNIPESEPAAALSCLTISQQLYHYFKHT